MKSEKQSKWVWMMDYCKAHQMPPAQKWAWGRAKKAWQSEQKSLVEK